MTNPESPWRNGRREPEDEDAGTIIGRPPPPKQPPPVEQPSDQHPQSTQYPPGQPPQSTQSPQQYPQQGQPPGPVHGSPYQIPSQYGPPQPPQPPQPSGPAPYGPPQSQPSGPAPYGPPQSSQQGGPPPYGPSPEAGPAPYGPPQSPPPEAGPAPYGPPRTGPAPYQPVAFGPAQPSSPPAGPAPYGPAQPAPPQAGPAPYGPPQAAQAQAAPPQAGPGPQGQAAPPPGQYPSAQAPGAYQTAPPPGAPAQIAPAPTAPPETSLAVPAPWSTTVTRPTGETGAEAAARSATQGAVIGAGQARAEALAIPDAGHRGPPRTKRGDHRRPSAPARAISGKLARLRIGSHTVSRSALGQLRISSLGAGLVLGADRYQRPVSVRLFRPQSTRVTLIGGTWAGQLVAFRAVGIGARIAVITSEPAAWQGFGERATGRGDRVAVMAVERSLAFMATVQQPVLVIYDLGLVGATSPLPLGPWQTQLTILRHLDSPGVPLVQESDLVMLQRLGGEEAATAGRALQLPAPSSEFLQVMADDMLALVADGADRYISVAQTDVERQQTGLPRR